MTDAFTRASPVYVAATRARLMQRDRRGPAVVPTPDNRPLAGYVILLLGGAMMIVGLGSAALLIVGLAG